MILLLDQRDSFTFNLAHALGAAGAEVLVERAQDLSLERVLRLAPEGLVLGPGPGRPGGLAEELLRSAAQPASPIQFGILGICLGHQALATAFGGRLEPARELVHGQTRPVHHDGRGIFAGLPPVLELAQYNSLVVAEEDLPACLLVSARDHLGQIQGLRHRHLPIEGLQAHPESILCLEQGGSLLLANFVRAQSGGPQRGHGPVESLRASPSFVRKT